MNYYFLSPDISENRITFLWDNDLWLLDLREKHPVRLTSNLGVVTNSKFSPDGKYVALRVEVGRDGSSADIYSMRLSDGNLNRITFVSGKSTSRRMFTDIAGWTPEGRLVISTDSYMPFGAMTELYSVPPEGGHLEPLNYGPASHIIFAGKSIIIARNAYDMPHWKGYRGGTSGVLWKGKAGGEFEKFLDLKHHLSCPFHLNGRVFFITDKDGTGNLYSVDLEGRDLEKHTDFSTHYVRNAKSDGTNIVFQMGGDIYLYRPGGKPEKIRIENISAPSFTARRFVQVEENLENFSTNSDGSTISIIARGRAFTAPFVSGPVSETGSSAEHIRLPSHAGQNDLVYVSDRSGEEEIYVKDLRKGTESKITLESGIIEYLTVSPSGKKILLSNNRGDLFSLDLSSSGAKPSLLDHSDAGIIADMSFSPSEDLFTYAFPELEQSLGRNASTVIKVYSFKEKKPIQISESGSRDFSPTFSRDGNYLYFLSTRHLDPYPDNIVFDFSFPTSMVLIIVPMNSEATMRLDHIPEGYINQKKEDYSMDSLIERQRISALKPSEYKKVLSSAVGPLLLEYSVEGMSKYYLFSRDQRSGRIVKFDLESEKTDEITNNVLDFTVSESGNVIIARTSDRTLKRFEVSNQKQSTGENFDFSRIKLSICPHDEWKQMFSETKRLIRENYWNEEKILSEYLPNFSKYEPLVERLSTRFEFSDLLREMQGECRTSHSYEVGGELTDKPSFPSGKLGLDLEFDGKNYVVKHIVSANYSNRDEKSPSFASPVQLREGDTLLTVSGAKLDEKTTPEEAMYNRAGELLKIEFLRSGKKLHTYVRTMPDDKHLRYREWVESNRKYVHDRTGDRVGYIHIPDMGYNGFSEFTRLYPIEARKDGLIVDVRYNGGGSVSQLILEKLTKKRIGYGTPRRGEKQPYPTYSVDGPMVALSNENAGSDGDIFTHSFKLFNLGPVVGTRTWGGVVGINPKHKLVDGTMVTQPQFAFWFRDVKYGVENYGTDPTIEVQNSPSDYKNGRDSQLEKALEEMDTMMRKWKGRLKAP